MSNQEQANQEWIKQELAAVELEDARLNERCGELAVALSKQPSASINQACEDWKDTKAAYRLFQNKKVTPEKLNAPHQKRTVERMKSESVVLAIQDTTFFNYTHHPQTTGLGRIGNKKQNQHGFGLHSTLATTVKGLPLGVLTQEFFRRPWEEESHKPNELRKLPIEEKESYKWLSAMKQTQQLAPSGVSVVTICDREADIYDLFALGQEQEASWIVRASSDRCLVDEKVGKLWSAVERQSSPGELTIEIAQNQNRAAREAVVTLRYTQLTLQPPWRPVGKLLPITLKALLVREDHPAPDIEEPIEWLLLTNLPVTSFQEAVQIVRWYCCRWQIELFHKILKSGCTVEEARLETADRLQNYIALMIIIAWRLHWLTYINRTDPDLPATTILTVTEWQALYMHIHKTAQYPDVPPSVYQTVRWIAQLGGFLARKGDGEPGITVIWRGWQRLHDLAATLYLVKEQSQLMGNR